MRLIRTSAIGVLGAAVLLATAMPQDAQAASKTESVRKAYNRARTLYRQGKYAEAAKAFDEVKELRYHPIVDYGLARCYEALRDNKRAVYYYKKYVTNHAKHQMSPKHPKPADVKVKISVLEKGGTGGPPRTTPAHGGHGGSTTPPPAAGGSPGAAGPGGAGAAPPVAADPIPGPDPYALPMGPGSASTPGIGGGGAPPPRYRVRRRRPGPARRSILFSVDFGAASYVNAGNRDANYGGGVFASILWRIIPWFGVGVHGGATVVGADDFTYDQYIFAAGMLEVRGYIPIRRLDIWGSLGAGYASETLQIDGGGSGSLRGGALTAAVGIDVFLSRVFSIGVVGRIYSMFPNKFCSGGFCGSVSGSGLKSTLWYAGFTATYHLPLRFTRRRR